MAEHIPHVIFGTYRKLNLPALHKMTAFELISKSVCIIDLFHPHLQDVNVARSPNAAELFINWLALFINNLKLSRVNA